MGDRHTARIALAALSFTALPALGSGCATFTNVRSAVVDQRSSAKVELTRAIHPGYVAGTFYGGLCDGLCSPNNLLGLDASYTRGWRLHDDGLPVSLGGGIASLIPYAEGYIQLSESKQRPFGLGARIGTLGPNWMEAQIYERLDVPLANGARLLWNPSLYHVHVHVDNDYIGGTGTFTGIAQGVALQFGAGSMLFTPSAAAVWGRAERTVHGRQLGPESKLFGTFGVAIGFRHDPSEPRR